MKERTGRNNIIFSLILFAAACLYSTGLGVGQSQAEKGISSQASVMDAQIKSTLQTIYILNRHLKSHDLAVNVQNHVVTLSGEVESGIEKEAGWRNCQRR